jgi:hypothetical protein
MYCTLDADVYATGNMVIVKSRRVRKERGIFVHDIDKKRFPNASLVVDVFI